MTAVVTKTSEKTRRRRYTLTPYSSSVPVVKRLRSLSVIYWIILLVPVVICHLLLDHDVTLSRACVVLIQYK